MMSHAAAVKLAAQYRQFVDKNFEEYLIICSPGVKDVWDLKVIYNTCSDIR
jgi:hypothetical protein